tara:strand:- start:10093 stop:10266 length:174 start_codon:yes stop_codon:yes gene_type:complete
MNTAEEVVRQKYSGHLTLVCSKTLPSKFSMGRPVKKGHTSGRRIRQNFSQDITIVYA